MRVFFNDFMYFLNIDFIQKLIVFILSLVTLTGLFSKWLKFKKTVLSIKYLDVQNNVFGVLFCHPVVEICVHKNAARPHNSLVKPSGWCANIWTKEDVPMCQYMNKYMNLHRTKEALWRCPSLPYQNNRNRWHDLTLESSAQLICTPLN